MGLLGGSKVPVAEPMKKYGESMAEAAKCGRGCRIKVGPMIHLSRSLFSCSFSSPSKSVLFPSCGFLSTFFAYDDCDLFQLLYFFFLPLDLIT